METLFLFLTFYLGSCSYISRNRPDEGAEWSDANLDVVQLIHKYKYPAEVHYVTTVDGYVLTLHRIPHGRMCPIQANKGPIILQHGILSSSMHFVIPGTKRGLGYILADSCYDVWMPNLRGNSYSLKHITRKINSKKFWDFSFHEMGIYDYPAIFNYVLNQTENGNVSFIGHSQGTTAFIIFNIFHPDYNSNITAAFFLAPIAYLGKSRSTLLQILSRFEIPLHVAMEILGIYEVVEQNDLFTKLMEIFCSSMRPINPLICNNLLNLVTGFDSEQSNLTLLTIAARDGLYGASTKQMFHYAQLLESNKFRQYDYRTENLKIYGQMEPPEYNLKKASARIHLYCGRNDWLADMEDVGRLSAKLPNVQEVFLVKNSNFNHLDHLFAKDVLELEYDRLLMSLDCYYNKTTV